MAILYRATLVPTKMELINSWLPQQPWFQEADEATLKSLGSFRFDDPDGEVGVEIIVVAGENAVYQVPLTYRGAPLQDADSYLITTMDHSVLGKRWVYDAVGDPVYVAGLANAVLAGQPQAEQSVDTDGKLELLPEAIHLESTGPVDADIPATAPSSTETMDGVTTIRTPDLELLVARVLTPAEGPTSGNVLTATWDGQVEPAVVATAKGI